MAAALFCFCFILDPTEATAAGQHRFQLCIYMDICTWARQLCCFLAAGLLIFATRHNSSSKTQTISSRFKCRGGDLNPRHTPTATSSLNVRLLFKRLSPLSQWGGLGPYMICGASLVSRTTMWAVINSQSCNYDDPDHLKTSS